MAGRATVDLMGISVEPVLLRRASPHTRANLRRWAILRQAGRKQRQRRTSLLIAITMAFVTVRAEAQVSLMQYHGGKVVSPHIACLMWSPSSNPFTPVEVVIEEGYLSGLEEYMSGLPMGNVTGGLEPTLRQYGVWGAYFNGQCIQDHTDPGGPLGVGSGRGRVQAEIAHAQASLGLPPYDGQTVVMVFTKGWSLDESLSKTCAWHTSDGAHNLWAFLPAYHCSTDVTEYAAHELYESATDPTCAGWFGSNGCGSDEVCDKSVPGTVTFPNGISGPESPMSDNATYPVRLSLESPAKTPPVAVYQNTTGTVNVLARDASLHPVWIRSTDYGTTWSAPVQISNWQITETPSVISADGTTLDIYSRGVDGALVHWFYDGSQWSAPDWFGGYLIGPPAAAYQLSYGGLLNGFASKVAFTFGYDGHLYQTIGSSWSSVALPSGVNEMSPPVIVNRSPVCADLYIVGDNSHTYRKECLGSWQDVGQWDLPFFLNGGALSNGNEIILGNGADIFTGGALAGWHLYNSSGGQIASFTLNGVQFVGQVTPYGYPDSGNFFLYGRTFGSLSGGIPSGAISYFVVNSVTGNSSGPVSLPNAGTTTSPPVSSNNNLFIRRSSDGELVSYMFGPMTVQDLGIRIF